MDERREALQRWLEVVLKQTGIVVEPASEDASFRRYFRVHSSGSTYIAMDAPPGKEDCKPFVAIARAFAARGLNVPQVLGDDIEHGYLLLTDFGSIHYLDSLSTSNVNHLYNDAIHALLRLQANIGNEELKLPAYSRDLLLREMSLFNDWYLALHLRYRARMDEQRMLSRLFSVLADSALAQPQVWVHRDYHSRNLMIVPEKNPGVLDFQDAVVGPVSYDLVSLLRDCYINWPTEQVQGWVEAYRVMAVERRILTSVGMDEFTRWFDLMGIQRHLKAIGIFTRLKHRDGKVGFLKDIPRTMAYVIAASGQYEDLRDIHNFLRRIYDVHTSKSVGES
jgi:aminoglycoside/choline kinase family phosphotransferase